MKERQAGSDRAGVWAGVLAAAAGEIAASPSRRGRSPSSGLARGLVDVSPAMLVDGGVALVGKADKPGLVAIATGISAAAAAAGGALASRSVALGAATAVAPQVLGGLLALRQGDASPSGTATATAVGGVVAAGAIAPIRPVPRLAVVAVAAAAVGAAAADRRSRRRDATALRHRVHIPQPARALPPIPDGGTGRARGVRRCSSPPATSRSSTSPSPSHASTSTHGSSN